MIYVYSYYLNFICPFCKYHDSITFYDRPKYSNVWILKCYECYAFMAINNNAKSIKNRQDAAEFDVILKLVEGCNGETTEDSVFQNLDIYQYEIFKILEVIPAELVILEATKKIPYPEVLDIVSTTSEQLPAINTFRFTKKQINELSKAYVCPYDINVSSPTRIMYQTLYPKDSKLWYDPDIKYKYKSKNEMLKIRQEVIDDAWHDYRYARKNSYEHSPRYIDELEEIYNGLVETLDDNLSGSEYEPDSYSDLDMINDGIYKVTASDSRYKTFNIALPVNSYNLNDFFEQSKEYSMDAKDSAECEDILHFTYENNGLVYKARALYKN